MAASVGPRRSGARLRGIRGVRHCFPVATFAVAAAIAVACNGEPVASPSSVTSDSASATSTASDSPSRSESATLAEPSPSPESPPASTSAVPVIDLNERIDPTDVGGGYSVSACEGREPLLCVSRDGEMLGQIFFQPFPLERTPALRRELARHDEVEALRRNAEEYLRRLSADRAEACPEGYGFAAIDPQPAEVAGKPGITYGYVVADDEGDIVEAGVSFHVLMTDVMWLVGAAAMDEGACLPEVELAFAPLELGEFEERLAALVADMVMPTLSVGGDDA